jgi:urease accessory protein
LKPLFPEGGKNCHAVIVHPPGGIVAGDSLATSVTVGTDAHGVITTPGAQKWYRSLGHGATATTVLRVDSTGALEWMPQEAIVFDGAVARQNLMIQLSSVSKFFGWEIVCFGRRARSERFTCGSFAQQIRVYRDDAPLWVEHTKLVGSDPLFDSPLGWGERSVCASAWLAVGHAEIDRESEDASLIAWVRGALGGELAAVSQVAPGFFVLKVVGDDAESVRELLIRVWSQIRLNVFGLAPQRLRIWST